MAKSKMKSKVAVYLPDEDPRMDDIVMQGRDFEEATRTAIRAISTDFKGRVLFVGDGAKRIEEGMAATNRETTILPTVSGKKLTRRQVEVSRGYATHEAMHKVFTPFEELEGRMTAWNEDGLKLTRHLHNAIEDMRIENGAATLVPGSPKHLDAVTTATCRHFIENVLPEMEDPAAVMADRASMIAVAVTWAGRIKMGYPSKQCKAAFEALSQEIKDEANKIADVALSLPHGATGPGVWDKDVAKAGGIEAAEIAEKLAREIAEDEKKKQSQNQQQGSGNGPGGSGGGAGGSSGKGGGSGNGGGPQSRSLDPEVNDAASSVMSQGADNAYSNAGRYRVYTTEADVVLASRKRFGSGSDDLIDGLHDSHVATVYQRLIDPNGAAKYAESMRTLGPAIATIKRKLERSIMAMDRRGWNPRQRDGVVDTKRLPAIMTGDELVRKKRTENHFPSTAISMLVDCSGSMSGDRIKLAQKTTIVLAEAFSKTPVSLEVSGFTGYQHEDTMRQYIEGNGYQYDPNTKNTAVDGNGAPIRMSIKPPTYDRIDSCTMFMLKHFDERIADARMAIGNMADLPSGGTPDADAIIYAVRRLLKRRVHRRIMLVLADGGPGWTQNENAKRCDEQLRDSIEFAKTSGIEIVGIGINTGRLGRYYERHTNISDVEEMPKRIVDGVARMLLGERFVVDNADLLKSDRHRAIAAAAW